MEMLDQLYTIEDLEALEGDFELDEGRLVPMTNGTPKHGRVCIRVGARLDAHCEKTGDGVVLGNDTGFVLQRGPDTLRGPDVAVVLAERYAAADKEKWMEKSPDLVVEVASASQSVPFLKRKVNQYLQAGATLVWVVSPKRRNVTVYHADGEVETLAEGQVLSGAPVLPGFSCPVADLFA